jgi:hypothetical protein
LLGLEGNDLGRRRLARRGRRHGRYGGISVAVVRGSAVGAPTLVRTRTNARACACAWVRTGVGCERLGLRPGVGRKAAGRRSSWRSSGRRKKGGGGHGTRGRARTRAVCARVGGEACTKQPEEGAPLLCSRVRKAILHGRAMAAWQVGAHVVTRSGTREKGPKVQPGPLRLGRVRAGVHNCARVASLHGRVREREMRRRRATTVARSGNARCGGPTNQETEQSDYARVVELAAAPARQSFPAWLEGRHHQRRRRGGAVRASRSPSARRPGRP